MVTKQIRWDSKVRIFM